MAGITMSTGDQDEQALLSGADEELGFPNTTKRSGQSSVSESEKKERGPADPNSKIKDSDTNKRFKESKVRPAGPKSDSKKPPRWIRCTRYKNIEAMPPASRPCPHGNLLRGNLPRFTGAYAAHYIPFFGPTTRNRKGSYPRHYSCWSTFDSYIFSPMNPSLLSETRQIGAIPLLYLVNQTLRIFLAPPRRMA